MEISEQLSLQVSLNEQLLVGRGQISNYGETTVFYSRVLGDMPDLGGSVGFFWLRELVIRPGASFRLY